MYSDVTTAFKSYLVYYTDDYTGSDFEGNAKHNVSVYIMDTNGKKSLKVGSFKYSGTLEI